MKLFKYLRILYWILFTAMAVTWLIMVILFVIDVT